MDKEDDYEPIKNARKYKILAHRYLKQYKESVWIDGNFEIIGSIREYIKRYSKGRPLLCVIHPQRNCVYDEAEACVQLKKDDVEIITEQIEEYRKHNDKKTVRLMEDWWNELKYKSRRDQLSFNYVCWKNQYVYDISDINYWGNSYFNRVKHNL